MTIRNSGDAQATGVTVLDLVPSEVSVISADLHDMVEAVQIGSVGGREDIVWVVGDLGAGESLTLNWAGRATKLGDMAAANSAVVTADGGLSASHDYRSFLASSSNVATSNPEFEPIVKRKLIFRSPVVQDRGEAAGVLPFTGISRWIYAGIGAALIALGVLLIWLSGLEPRKRAGAIFIAGLLLFTACTSDDDAQPEVKGTRIERGDETEQDTDEAEQDTDEAEQDTQGQQGDAGQQETEPADAGVEVPDEDVADVPDVPPLPEPLPPPAQDARVVTIELEDLPVVPLDDHQGENAIAYEWDDGSRQITFATSSLIFVSGQTVELLSDVNDSSGGIDVHLKLRNTAERERLLVQGRLVHEIFGSQGRIARLVSNPIDVVLDPGGEVDARFFYRLPSGGYQTASSFQAD